MLLWLSTLAMAGYGDAVDGMPSPAERELVLWTNAARVDPAAFKQDYLEAGCSYDSDFTDIERTPQDPLRWNVQLNESARFHSQDMFDNNWFDHASSDGTPFATRLSRFYDHPGGENIAKGYADPYAAMFSGWMCSAGHRQNIMRPQFDELGTGIVGSLYTQNFGDVAIDKHPIGVGSHWLDGSRITFRAEVFDEGGAAPDRVSVVWNGVPGDMTLEVGEAARGIYRTSRDQAQAADTGWDGCSEYYFEAAWGEDLVRFPQDGSYGWGDCIYGDADAQWIDRQLEPEEEGGCSTLAVAPLGLVGGLSGLLVLARRRRRSG